MSVSMRHLFRQGSVIRALGRMAFGKRATAPIAIPGPVTEGVVPPRHPDLVRDYIRYLGGDPAWYHGTLPPHFFPQWGFPLMGQALGAMPFDMRRILNVGFQFEVRTPLPADEPLRLSAQLEELDENEFRAIIKTRLTSGTESAPEALVAHVHALIPIRKAEKKDKPKDPPIVPVDAREIDRWNLSGRAGFDYALLSGDINPMHWLGVYARSAGFKNQILHGFAIAARLIESINRNILVGRVGDLAAFETRFARPLVLPARVNAYTDDAGGVFVGDAPGSPAYVIGNFTKR